ncbi:MAG: hypothetical protein M3P30_10820 [Chloroflexota bacterium]|nr:hypothetical protein [Chloroflexota bacterium]
MSKLSDKIRKVTRLQSLAMGFGSMRNAVEPTMVLAALARDAQAAEEMGRRGADVVIVEANGAAPGPGIAKDGAVVGARIAGRTDNEAKSYKDAGYDFVVFNPDEAAATALLEENIGYVMAAPADLSDTEWRTLEAFQLDAIDIGAIDGAMTVRRQIDLRRILGMARKPLMATVSGDISVAALQTLRDTNIVVVIAADGAAVEKLRKTIDALPPRSRRKDLDDRPLPLVPQSASVGDGDEPEHDHDE